MRCVILRILTCVAISPTVPLAPSSSGPEVLGRHPQGKPAHTTMAVEIHWVGFLRFLICHSNVEFKHVPLIIIFIGLQFLNLFECSDIFIILDRN